jgi:hypothetical protein
VHAQAHRMGDRLQGALREHAVIMATARRLAPPSRRSAT